MAATLPRRPAPWIAAARRPQPQSARRSWQTTGVAREDAKRKGKRPQRRGRESRPKPAANMDERGFRPNVAMVIQNRHGQVLWARRKGGHDAWQFPQGGIAPGETDEQALYRELREEVGLAQDAVNVLARAEGWLRYRVPPKFRRGHGAFTGQKQRWFLLRLLAGDDAVNVHGEAAEFDDWRWVSYWYPLGEVVWFKRSVYRRGLLALAPALRLEEVP